MYNFHKIRIIFISFNAIIKIINVNRNVRRIQNIQFILQSAKEWKYMFQRNLHKNIFIYLFNFNY